MATLRDVARARKLINDLSRINNLVRQNVDLAVSIRSTHVALPQAEQDASLQAIRDLGFDDTEFIAIANAMVAVQTRLNELGVVMKDLPSPV